MREEVIQHALGHGATASADAGAQSIAGAAVRALGLLFAELEPLIGAGAVQALYARSLYLLRPGLPWLAAARDVPGSEPLSGLRRALASRTPAEAQHASLSLLRTLTDLLISLVGEPLINRMLHAAWSSLAADRSALEKPR